MRRLGLRIVLGVVAISSAVVWIRNGWLLASTGIALGAAVVWLSRCRHPRPLGLNPPVIDEHGNRIPAHWFCGQCGKAFPADFERDHAPVQRFAGHDESKATQSARRAEVFDTRRRQLAVQRAGMPVPKRAVAAKPAKTAPAAPPAAARAAGPVSIHDHRRVG